MPEQNSGPLTRREFDHIEQTEKVLHGWHRRLQASSPDKPHWSEKRIRGYIEREKLITELHIRARIVGKKL